MERLGERSSFFLVGNIPPAFRSSDLRGFFSHFAERRGFTCFHYRHRPEQPLSRDAAQSSTATSALGDQTQSEEATQTQPPSDLPSETVGEVSRAESVVDGRGSVEVGRCADGSLVADGGGAKEQGGLLVVGDEKREGGAPPPPVVTTCCCVVAVVRGMEREFLDLHRNKHWTLPDGELLRRRVRINRLRVEVDAEKNGRRLISALCTNLTM